MVSRTPQFFCTSWFYELSCGYIVVHLSPGGEFLYVIVYMDDIIIVGEDSLVQWFNAALASRFSLNDLGTLRYFFGIEATRSAHGLHLMQEKYIIDLPTKKNMLDSKPVSTPMAATLMISLFSGSALDDASEYRPVLGSLQYLSFTRHGIAFAVNRLSQFMHRPTNAHWLAAKRILRYLAGTTNHVIFLLANNPLTVHAFSDIDWKHDSEIIFPQTHTLSTLETAQFLGFQRNRGL